MSCFSQFDWWDTTKQVFSRVDSDADLQSNFASSWFPVNTGLPGDPHDFAVHWEGQFYVAENKSYTYNMGSDDDSWLFIDNKLVLDLGGIHSVTNDSYDLPLSQGYHNIDIFFAERNVTQSGFKINFFSDFVPIPDPSAVFLLGAASLIGFGVVRRKFKK